MRKLLSTLSLIAGIWLMYTGYERQHSLAGRADDSLSRIGQKMDGGDHTPAHVTFYAAGIVLLCGAAVGLGLVRK